MVQQLIQNSLAESQSVLDRFVNNPKQIQAIEAAAQVLVEALKNGHKIISCGNGGSHCDAMHFAEELSGRYRENRPALAAMAISDPSHITCVSNDFGYNFVFSRFIEGLGQEGDVLVGISTSGNSASIIEAVSAAKQKGMKVILLTGKDGGKLANLGDAEIRVEHEGFADRIQEIHIKVIHIMIQLVEYHIFGRK
ncbi:D-sedoheptulose 7-phosphate isomerase [Aquirufa nivalisilvae]|uniref:Phosphoheptose isomerase n=1 Tax=Aquirufa nivalisilvae TaxID=2516557 RepID=A0A2S2DUJ3_9BACT|nr:D-sedoheptulose 7-phosphate isomerase [Aquirufa nivalisilvae]AWL08477.1 D-sedoheptulose 7-phosphate isomerase [Aquirufa nivalisilvae]MCZ2478947.1 D-sedoheptulose 7-phosphate isomerase [Aquirufa nivalisilvae]TBH75877.1 D-sedoheptulose 7-phosphate isomerase [Aquirufa nivalisilvae]